MLSPGDPAPPFELPADDGSTVDLAGLHGQRVVIYFYPKDDTPGCTRQACALRDAQADFDAVGATVIDEDGRIVQALYNVKPEATAPGALAALASSG